MHVWFEKICWAVWMVRWGTWKWVRHDLGTSEVLELPCQRVALACGNIERLGDIFAGGENYVAHGEAEPGYQGGVTGLGATSEFLYGKMCRRVCRSRTPRCAPDLARGARRGMKQLRYQASVAFLRICKPVRQVFIVDTRTMGGGGVGVRLAAKCMAARGGGQVSNPHYGMVRSGLSGGSDPTRLGKLKVGYAKQPCQAVPTPITKGGGVQSTQMIGVRSAEGDECPLVYHNPELPSLGSPRPLRSDEHLIATGRAAVPDRGHRGGAHTWFPLYAEVPARRLATRSGRRTV